MRKYAIGSPVTDGGDTEGENFQFEYRPVRHRRSRLDASTGGIESDLRRHLRSLAERRRKVPRAISLAVPAAQATEGGASAGHERMKTIAMALRSHLVRRDRQLTVQCWQR